MRWRRGLAIAIALPLAATALFLLSAWIGSAIPRNGDWVEPAEGIEIFVGDNGIHTELVLPLVAPEKDWRGAFPSADVDAWDRPYTHVAVSWGERRVFLETPTWADLDPLTAIGAATGGEGLLHVAHYVRPAPSSTNRPLRLTSAQYERLVRRIETQVVPASRRMRFPGYADWDVFYAAPGRYHMGNSCNQWTSDTLAAAGVKTGWWTPLPGGVMKWVPEPR